MEGWNKVIGSKIKLVFDDGKSVSAKVGTLKEVADEYLGIETSFGLEYISRGRIVRMEIFGGQEDGRTK